MVGGGEHGRHEIVVALELAAADALAAALLHTEGLDRQPLDVAAVGDGDDAGHGQDLRREALAAGAAALRPAAQGHRADAQPAAPDLREDGRLRPLRPGRARVHLGTYG